MKKSPLEARIGLKHCFMRYLQYATDRIKTASLPLPMLDCVVLQLSPTIQLADNTHVIECELTNTPKPNIKGLQGKWIKLYRYTFSHKPGKRYVLVLDYFIVCASGPGKIIPEYPKNCTEDPLISQYMKIHQQYVERQKLSEFIDDLPSFDQISLPAASKKPVCLVIGNVEIPANLIKSTQKEFYRKIEEKEAKACYDVKIDDITQKKTIAPLEPVKPIACEPRKIFEVTTQIVIDDPLVLDTQKEQANFKNGPSLGTMDADVSKSLANLRADLTPAVKQREIVLTQHEISGTAPMEDINKETQEKQSETKFFVNRIIEAAAPPQAVNIGLGTSTDEKVTKLAALRESEKKGLSTAEKTTDLLDMLKEGSEEDYIKLAPKIMNSAEYERYLTWRNFRKQASSVSRKLEFNSQEVNQSELVEFTVEPKPDPSQFEPPASRKKL